MDEFLHNLWTAFAAMLGSFLDATSWLLTGPFGFIVVRFLLGACAAGALLCLLYLASLVMGREW